MATLPEVTDMRNEEEIRVRGAAREQSPILYKSDITPAREVDDVEPARRFSGDRSRP